jgi:hypothetical protein
MTKINLNKPPYFDDYNEQDRYYQILFKPGRAVQARELTQLQTILQKQIERLGSHIFKDGSQVIPANENGVRYIQNNGFLKLAASTETFTHTNESLENNWLNKKIKNEAGVEAVVIGYRPEDALGEVRLFVTYTKASDDGSTLVFFPEDTITVIDSIPTITAQIPGAILPDQSLQKKTGSIASVVIQPGVYFYSGYFVYVDRQTIFVTPPVNPDSIQNQNLWDNKQTASVGLTMTQIIKTSEDDPNLLDVALGTPNYSAPGADRLYIDASLEQRLFISDATKTDQNFIELLSVNKGEVTYKVMTAQYGPIEATLARRTFDESGDYTVTPFNLQLKEFLRDNGNNGVHDETEFFSYTIEDATALATGKFSLSVDDIPSSSLPYCVHPNYSNPTVYMPGTSYDGPEETSFKNLCDRFLSARIDPGKAYVKGYEIQKLARSTVDIPKARSVAYKTNQTTRTPLGLHMVVTDVVGSIDFDIHQPVTLYSSLYNTSTRNVDATSKMGEAKILYIDFMEGVTGSGNSGKYRLYMYDIVLDDDKQLEKVKSFRAASTSTSSTDFYANIVLSQISLSGSVSRDPQNAGQTATPNTLYGTGTKWKNDAAELLVAGDLIRVGNVIYTVDETPSSDTTLKVKEDPQATKNDQDSTWTNGSSFTYMFTLPQTDSDEASLVFNLPDQYIATIREGGSNPSENPFQKTQISANYTVPKVFSEQQVASNGQISLTNQLAPNETFAIFSSRYAVINESTGNWLRVISGSGVSSDANTATIQQTSSSLTVWVNEASSSTPYKYTIIAPTLVAEAAERKKVLQKGYFDPQTDVYVSTFSVVNNATPVVSSGSGGGYVLVEGVAAGEISLHMADVLRITRIVETKDPGSTPTGQRELDPNYEKDITASYIFDNGQKDYVYDISKVTLRPDVEKPIGKVRVEFDYFTHSDDGGRYFSVDSYGIRGTNANMEYSEIPTYAASDGTTYKLSDCIDFRRKVTDAVERVSIDSFTCSYYTYLGRKDKIILNSQTKVFELSQGTSALNPLPADENPVGMSICELTLEPYTNDSKSVAVRLIENKRYTMRDIEKLENRIKNLEYYTSLTLLEVETAKLTVTDANGNERFKNGFLADNFSTFNMCDLGSLDFKCSLDTTNNVARPLVFNDAVFLYESAVDEAAPDTYRQTKTGPYKKTGELYTLPYTEKVFIRQGLASKVININPFNITSYVGDIKLTPWSDEWRETNLLPDQRVQDSAQFDEAMALVGPTGTSISYNATINNWTGSGGSGEWQKTGRRILKVAGHDVLEQLYPNKRKRDWPKFVIVPEPYANAGQRVPTGGFSWVTNELRSTTTITGNQIQMGLETSVKDLGWSPEQRALTLVNTTQIQWMRSREIEFEGHCFRRDSRLYAFFDDVSVTDDCRPTPDEGWVTFTITADDNTVSIHSTSANQSFTSSAPTNTYSIRPGAELVYNGRKFEVTQTINSATLKVAPKNTPENTQTPLTSTTPIVIMVTKYTYGDPLQADSRGSVKGVFKIPAREDKKFATGDAVFRLTTSSVNARFPNPLAQNTSMGDARFRSTGWLDTQQYTVTQTRMYEVTSNLVSTVGAPINMQTGDVFGESAPFRRDPIAQTFLIREDGGCFITGIDIFFFSKPSPNGPNPNVPITLELRSVTNGVPIESLPAGKLSVIIKQTNEIVTNTVNLANRTLTVTGSAGGTTDGDSYVWTASTPVKSENLEKGTKNTRIVSGVPFVSTDMALDMVPTRFTFESPIYLNPNTDYSFVLLSDSDEYNVWVAEIANNDEKTPMFNEKSGQPNKRIGTDIDIGTQVYQDGNFYKSHNASGWAIDNKISVKFALHKAEFDISQTAEIDFVNQELFDRRLFTDGIEVQQGSPLFRVVLPNHGLSVGDKLRIRNITTPADQSNPDTIKGILKSVFADLIVTRTEIDHVIVRSATLKTTEGYVATSTGRLGGTTATISDNRRFEDMTLITTPFAPPTTSLEWKMVTTSSGGITNLPHTSIKLPFVNFTPNERYAFDSSMKINSTLNEPTATRKIDKKSLIVTALLRSTNPNLSPVIDESRMTAALTMNRLDAPIGKGIGAQNINDVFDTLNIITTADDASGKVWFSTSTGVLTGTFTSDTTIVTKDLADQEDLRSRLRAGDFVSDPSSGQTIRVVEVLSATQFRTEAAFNPRLDGVTLYANPQDMVIKTDNLLIAQKLSQLDIGKYVTLAGATGTRSCTDVLVLDVVYTPSSTTIDTDLGPTATCKCLIKLGHKTDTGSGRESNDFTLTQKNRYINEIAPSGGSHSAKYVCKKLVVSRVSNAVKITFDASRDQTCELDLYYRTEKPNSTVSIDDEMWTKAPFNIDVDGVLQNSTPGPDASGTVFSSYEATVEGLLGFVGAQAKIVMRGGNAAKPPQIKNFRMIVLDE